MISIIPYSDDAQSITKSEILLLLPTGSRWSQAIGWRSIFGIPLQTRTHSWLVVGTIDIVSHLARGGFPVLNLHFFHSEKPPLVQLRNVANAIYTLSEADKKYRLGGVYGVIFTHSHSLKEHAPTESKILWQSAYRYENKESFLFSTLILSDDQLKSSNFPGPYYHPTNSYPRVAWKKYLLSTTDILCTTSSSPGMKWASLNRFIF